MVGSQGAGESAPAARHRSAQERLKGLGYYQPLSRDSLGLAERLLGDVARSAESLGRLQLRAEEQGHEARACSQQLRLLRQHHPRLLRENTELHRRLLADSCTHREGRLRWAKEVEATQARLSHVQTLRDHQGAQAVELQRSVEMLRSHIAELQRLGVGAATEAVLRPRTPCMSIRGGDPRVSKAGSKHAGAMDTSALAAQAQELGLELASKRRQRALEAAELAVARPRASAAQAEVARLGGSGGSARVGACAQASPEAVHVEEPPLLSQTDFLRRARETLQAACQALHGKVSMARAEVGGLRSGAEQLRQGIAAAQEAVAPHKGVVSGGPDPWHKACADMVLSQREASAEHAALAAAQEQLDSQLEEARSRLAWEAHESAQHLRGLQEMLTTECRSTGLEDSRGLEQQLEQFIRLRGQLQTSRADLSAKLSAAHMQEATQRQVLEARFEEAAADQRSWEALVAEAEALSARLNGLESSVFAARSEAVSLRACLAEATIEHSALTTECTLARCTEEALRGEAEARQEAQHQLATEVEHMQTSLQEVEESVAEECQEEAQLQARSTRLRRGLAHSEDRLAGVQRAHRELSSGVRRALNEILQSRAELRSQLAGEKELKGLLRSAQQEVERQAAGRDQARLHQAHEEQLLTEGISATQSANADIEQSERRAQEELLSRLGLLEPDAHDLRREVADLLAETPRLLAGMRAREAAAATEAAAESQALALELSGGLRLGEGEQAADAGALHALGPQSRGLELRAEQLADEVMVFVAALCSDGREEAELEVAARLRAQESSRTQAGLAAAARRLKDLHKAECTAEECLGELRLKQEQLDGLLHGLEEATEQLVGQLQHLDGSIEGERQVRREALEGPPEARGWVEELAAEGLRLRRTLETVDADQAELMQIASDRFQGVQCLRLQSTQLQATRSDLQWTLGRLRHAVDLQQGEFAFGIQEAEATAEEVESLEAAERAMRSEVHERQRDAALGMDDLVHMTRENQLLHDELLRVKHQNEALSTVAHDQASALSRQQALWGTELECENVVRVYQQVLDERRRNETAIAEITSQAEHSRLEAEAMQARLAMLQRREESARAQLLRGSTELLAVRARFSDVARTLEVQELAQEQASIERSRVQHLVGTQQAATSEAHLSSTAAGAEVGSLRAEVESLQRELQEAHLSLASWHWEREEAARREAKLQELLAQQRRAQQQLQAAGLAMREQLVSSGDPALAASGCCVPAPPADGEAAEGIRWTLEQQGALLAQMTAERRALASKVEQLHNEFAEQQQLARALPLVPPLPGCI